PSFVSCNTVDGFWGAQGWLDAGTGTTATISTTLRLSPIVFQSCVRAIEVGGAIGPSACSNGFYFDIKPPVLNGNQTPLSFLPGSTGHVALPFFDFPAGQEGSTYCATTAATCTPDLQLFQTFTVPSVPDLTPLNICYIARDSVGNTAPVTCFTATV